MKLATTICRFLLLLLINSKCGATTISSSGGGGSWLTAASWSPAVVPTSTDSVIITSGNPITLGYYGYCGSLNIQSGASLAINAYALYVYGNFRFDGSISGSHILEFMGSNKHMNGAATFNFSGYYYFNGNYTIDSAFTIYNYGTMTVVGATTIINYGSVYTNIDFSGTGGKWVNGRNAFWEISGSIPHSFILDAAAVGNTVEYGWSNPEVYPSSTGYYNLNISSPYNSPGLVSDITVIGNLINYGSGITSNGHTVFLGGHLYDNRGGPALSGLNINFTGTLTHNFSSANGVETLNNLTISSGSVIAPYMGGLNVNNVLINNGGTFNASSLNGITVFGNWTDYGTFTGYVASYYYATTFEPASGVTDSIYSSSGIETFYNFSLYGAGTLKLASNLKVTGCQGLNSGYGMRLYSGMLNAGNHSDTIFCAGNWSNTGTTFNPGNGTVIFKGYYQTVTKSSGVETYNNVVCNPLYGAGVTLSCPISCSGNFSLVSDFVNILGLAVNGNISISSGTTFGGGAYSVTLGGNWTNNGTFTTSTGSLITLNGSSAQTITKASGSETFRKLKVNKSAGTVTLNNPLIVTDTLFLTKGSISTASSNILSLNNGTGLVGGSDTGYVSGPMAKYGNTAFTFPLGSTALSSGAYHPLSITAPSTTTDEFVAQYYPIGQTYGSATDDSIQSLSTSEYWTLNRSAGSSTPQVTLGWNSNNSLSDSYYDYRIVAWDGTAWRNKGASAFSTSGSKGSVKTATAAVYSPNPQPFTLATIKFYSPFAVLKKKLDGGYTTINSHGMLAFIYPEEYNDTDSKLTYNIYDKNNNVIASNATASSGYVPVVNFGDNRYALNMLSSNLGVSSITHGSNYILEVINEKNEKWYLRARY